MSGPNIQPIHVAGEKQYVHPERFGGYPRLPWPRGSKEANRFFNERRHKRNVRKGKPPSLATIIRRQKYLLALEEAAEAKRHANVR
ncbi:MAG: hypothetical protein KGL39_36240 [Patescibacteria group bacterium]|nr:hypothetical protein [Patescibacteria group bacterium]